MTLGACHPSALPLGSSDAGDASHPACPECDEHVWCARSADTVVCTCRDRFTGDGRTCADIDECAQDTAPCDHQSGICTNTNGGYACSCVDGWNLGSDGATCVEACKAVQVAAGGDHSCARPWKRVATCSFSLGRRSPLPPGSRPKDVTVHTAASQRRDLAPLFFSIPVAARDL